MEYSVNGSLEINNLGVLKDNRCKIRFLIIKNNDRKLPISDYSSNNLPDRYRYTFYNDVIISVDRVK